MPIFETGKFDQLIERIKGQEFTQALKVGVKEHPDWQYLVFDEDRDQFLIATDPGENRLFVRAFYSGSYFLTDEFDYAVQNARQRFISKVEFYKAASQKDVDDV